MLRLASMCMAAFAVSACAAPNRRADTEAPTLPAARAAAAPFPFAGTWHVVGAGFPEGPRDAVMVIMQRDTAYTMRFVSGAPPGRLRSMSVAGDSVHVYWELDDGEFTELMTLNLRGVRDSLVGRWELGYMGGAFTGMRRSPSLTAQARATVLGGVADSF